VLLAIATGVLLIVLARRQIVAPLEKLADAARRVEAGATSAPVDIASGDEIGRLARAWNAMGTAVEDRERRLADREKRLADANRSLRELLDHMRQAIVVVGASGSVDGEQSRMAAKIFGLAALGGRSLAELLYPGREEWDAEVTALRQWITLAFEVDPTAWDEITPLAPNEVSLRAGTQEASVLRLEFRPIVREGAVARVMLLATDLTEERKLEGMVRNQEERHARQIATMRRLVGGGSQGFVDFLSRARFQLDACEQFAEESSRRLSSKDVEGIFREVHTLRGEANAFDIADLANEASTIESCLVELRTLVAAQKTVAPVNVLDELAQRIASARAALNMSEQIFVGMAPAGRLALEQVVVRRSHLAKLEALVGNREDEIGRVVAMLAARPMGEIADPLIDQTPAWAEKEGKKVRLELDGRETLLSQRLAQWLPGVLTHLVRNAIAHGIERPDDRRAAGKPEVGTIRIECRADSGGARMSISDDGAGVDARAVVAAARDRGIATPSRLDDDRAVTDLLFAEGLTTQADATELAGHGVGLGAVRRHLSAEGYAIVMQSVRGRGTTVLLEPNSTT
jgi:two-component system chemotaxis sensor kinase CheA